MGHPQVTLETGGSSNSSGAPSPTGSNDSTRVKVSMGMVGVLDMAVGVFCLRSYMRLCL